MQKDKPKNGHHTEVAVIWFSGAFEDYRGEEIYSMSFVSLLQETKKLHTNSFVFYPKENAK